jgi:hypothetical protein
MDISVIPIPFWPRGWGFLAEPTPGPSQQGGHVTMVSRNLCKTWQLHRLILDAWTSFWIKLLSTSQNRFNIGRRGLFPWAFHLKPPWFLEDSGVQWSKKRRDWCRRCSLQHWQCGDVAPAQLWGTSSAPMAGCRWICSGCEPYPLVICYVAIENGHRP